MKKNFSILYLVSAIFLFSFQVFFAQGLTTGSMNGLVGDIEGNPLPGANVIALHVPTGTQYGASTRDNGQFNIPSMRVGGPYTITVSYVGFEKQTQENVMLNLGQKLRIDFTLSSETVEMGQVVVTGEEDDVLNGNRTGAATFINPESITALPSIKRSTRDITRLDPRSDGNYSFGGKNWLYNNISVDGSYFNNPFGLDDPSPGGQTSAEPIPFDAVEQVQVSIAPFDVREGGFTGAGINTVTKSGTNQYKVSLYSFFRNESLIGNKISGEEILVPELMFNQSGITAGGPIIKNKLFIFLGYETVTRQDPGSGAFIADSDNDPTNNPPGVSRVSAETMNQIRQRMVDVYGFDPGPYQGFNHDTKNQKFLLKLDWNINENNNLTFRYNFLDASQQKPPHPFAISFNNTGRGPNQTSMPFQNSGYTMNNELNSFALEFNSRFENSSNKFFVSYNIFRDFRSNTSQPYPTIEIAEGGVTYTTVG
ncbi:MAG: carboxypeptidase-like regulatory domain-containing protein, partial [Bacteroidota bacterium]